jgi:hypothetical protein
MTRQDPTFDEDDPSLNQGLQVATNRASIAMNPISDPLDRVRLRFDRGNEFQSAGRQRPHELDRVPERDNGFLGNGFAAVRGTRDATPTIEEVVLVAQSNRDLLHFHSFMAR